MVHLNADFPTTKSIPNKNEHVRTKDEAKERGDAQSVRHTFCSGAHLVQDLLSLSMSFYDFVVYALLITTYKEDNFW
jgi:hypothetical protein